MCSRNPWRTVRKGNKLITHQPDCMCWGCDECRPKLKKKWIWHATKVLQAEEKTLAYLFCSVDEVESVARSLRRRKCNYFRIRRKETRFLFIFSCDQVPEMAARCSVRDACDAFAEKVNEIKDSSGGNPISSSRSWSLPSRDHSDWDLIAIGPAPSAVRSAAFLALADFVERNIGGTTVAICSGETDKIDRLCDLIGSLANYPTKNQGANKGNRCSGAFGIALEDFQPCGDGYYSGRVLMT